MVRPFVLAAAFALGAAPALATEPTIADIRAEAQSGDISGALAKMSQVLKDHPGSAKAHYVEAELLARNHDFVGARGELAKVQSIDPGFKGITGHSLGELQAQLNGTRAETRVPTAVVTTPSIPWTPIIIIGLVVLAFLAMLRRRPAANYAPGAGAAYPAQPGVTGMGPGPAPGYAPGYGGGMMGGGMGAGMGGGMLGGLARGAAMGAGFAAGERVIDDVFGGGHGGQGGFAGGDAGPVNPDMGGDNFGIEDSGSWDDSGGGSGDGGW